MATGPKGPKGIAGPTGPAGVTGPRSIYLDELDISELPPDGVASGLVWGTGIVDGLVCLPVAVWDREAKEFVLLLMTTGGKKTKYYRSPGNKMPAPDIKKHIEPYLPAPNA